MECQCSKQNDAKVATPPHTVKKTCLTSSVCRSKQLHNIDKRSISLSTKFILVGIMFNNTHQINIFTLMKMYLFHLVSTSLKSNKTSLIWIWALLNKNKLWESKFHIHKSLSWVSWTKSNNHIISSICYASTPSQTSLATYPPINYFPLLNLTIIIVLHDKKFYQNFL